MASLNLVQFLNGLTFAALLFIVASGFTLIFGLLRIVNLAHELFLHLGERRPEYLMENFDVPQE